MMNVRRICVDYFPEEVADHVLSYLPDLEFINIGKVSDRLLQSVGRLIRRRELNFKSYRLWDEHIVYLKEKLSDVIVSLNLNACVWLSENVISSVNQMSNLQELHLIECQVGLQTCEAILDMKLSSLSMTWGTNWVEAFRNRPSNTNIQLFLHLKHLAIFITDEKMPNFYVEIVTLMLRHCVELETFKLYDSVDKHCLPEMRGIEPCEFLLPKLKSLIVDLGDQRFQYFSYDRFARMIRETGKVSTLQEVLMGKLCIYVIEREPPILDESTSVYCSPVDEVLQIYLQKDWLSIPTIFHWRKLNTVELMTCKRLKVKECFNTLAFELDRIHEIPEQIGGVNAHLVLYVMPPPIFASADWFLETLETLASFCSNVTYLDLNMKICDFTQANKQSLLQILSQFKDLKRLDLPSYLISMFSQLNWSEGRAVLGAQSEISEDSMRESNLWEVTQCCKSIEEIRITQPTIYLSHPVVSESSLACISQWKNLKELYLNDVSTPEWGGFLPVITRNCPQLTTLHLIDICKVGDCVYMAWLTECLAQAKSLKDLAVFHQSAAVTVQFCKNLEQCEVLERLILDDIYVPRGVGPHLANVLSKLKGLVRVAICLRDADEATRDVIEKPLKILKVNRPSSRCILNDVSVSPGIDGDQKSKVGVITTSLVFTSFIVLFIIFVIVFR